MLLYIAIKVAMGRKSKFDDLLPSNRSELYKDFIFTLFSHHKEKGKHLRADSIQIKNALTDLYFNLQCRNEVSCKYSEALKLVKKSSEDPLFRKISPQVILEDCFKLGLLNKNDYHISYEIHQSFQEYFAAIKLKELFESGYDVSEAFSNPKWEEVVIFTSEMLGSVDEFIELMIFKKELYLASKCTNKASDETKEKLCALLADKMSSKYKMEKINSIKSLGMIGNTGVSNTAVQPLVNALKDEDSDVRRRAAEALGKTKSDTAVQLLINALNGKYYDVRERETDALGNIKSDTAVQLLIKALKGENLGVRQNAAKALGNIKSDTAVQPLINALKDEGPYVREGAARALGNIKSDTAVQPLINALKDEDSDVQWIAAKALGKICTTKNKKQLEELLKSEHEFSVNIAYKILYEIEKEERSKVILFKDEKFLKS